MKGIPSGAAKLFVHVLINDWAPVFLSSQLELKDMSLDVTNNPFSVKCLDK